jgi:DNA repair exonuclease SbcCD ATPase subunit
MSFFTFGNLLTLGIVILMLILYRQLDRNNRSVNNARKYGNRLKEDLAVFVAEKEAAVRDYGVELDVLTKSAKELMKRLSTADGGLADKAAAVTKIDERLNAYDASLEELVRMTARVQENLNRIRDESAFVEAAGRRVTEAKTRLESMERNLEELEFRFERKNAESLEKTSEAVVAAVSSTVSDLQAAAETVERQVEDHREAIDKAEKDRAAHIARDMELIQKTLKEAVERAASRADKIEDAAVQKLRDQAMERVRRFQEAVEDRLKQYQESARTRVAEVQGLVKTYKEEWRSEHAGIEAKQKLYRDEWKQDIQELNALARSQQEEWRQAAAAAEVQIRDAERRALEAADKKLEEYQNLQTVQYRQLDALAEDMKKLDGELRISMQETENRVRRDFALFEQDSAAGRERFAAECAASVETLRVDISGVEQELAALKERAYENVSEKLKIFEDDFAADLARRGAEIDGRFGEWRDSLESRLAGLGEEAAAERRNLEISLNDTMKSRLSILDDQYVSELEHLKAETGAFEEGIRGQMAQADQSLQAFKEQMDRDLEEARNAAELSTKAEIGRYALSMTETLKQHQRELETALKDMALQVEGRLGEMTGVVDSSRRELDEWQARFNVQLRETENDVEEGRRRIRELAVESDERLSAVRAAIEEVREESVNHRNEIFTRADEQYKALDSAIKEADRHIKEFIAQTKLFDQAEDLKLHLERRIEDLRGDLNGLDQRRAEAAELETQFIKIRRLEDDINAKMTRFLSDKRRIELMEADVNRLIATSQSVEERLVQVSSSDDVLQAMQVQIRRLNDALADTEERYQRIEKKNQILEETNSSIDRNFKSLQETEEGIGKFNGELLRLSLEQRAIGDSLKDLAAKNELARETSEKLSTLDEDLTAIEKRIDDMQVAREWLANIETRLGEIYKQSQEQVKLMGSLLKEEGPARSGRGAPPLAIRENVVKLRRQGWTVDEIARATKLGKGEVELILEIAPRD